MSSYGSSEPNLQHESLNLHRHTLLFVHTSLQLFQVVSTARDFSSSTEQCAAAARVGYIIVRHLGKLLARAHALCLTRLAP